MASRREPGKPLANPRHEIAAQEYAAGATEAEAYESAGFEPDSGNASRLFTGNDSVRERVEELLDQAALLAVDAARDYAVPVAIAAMWIEAGKMHWFVFTHQAGVDAFVLKIAQTQGDWLTWLWKAAFVLTWPAVIWGGRLIAFATRPPPERLD